jgi:hypothetical protein
MSNITDTADQIPMQNPASGAYGAEVMPNPPIQDMFASFQVVTTRTQDTGTVHTRDDDVTQFTGGMGGRGIGGVAEPSSPIADVVGGPQRDAP